MHIQHIIAIAAALLIGPVNSSAADDTCDPANGKCVAVGQWSFSVAVGAGKRQNPIADRDDIPLFVVPQFSYYGERFFIENLDLGYTLFETYSTAINIVATPGYDRVFFYDSDPQNVIIDTGGSFSPGSQGGPNSNQNPPTPPTIEELVEQHKRKVTYLSGLEWTTEFKYLQWQTSLLSEVTGRHDGNEIRTALAVPWATQYGSLSFTIGATWKSSETMTYYYGAPDVLNIDSSLMPFAKLSYSKKLSDKWRLLGLVHYQNLGDDIAVSPIVEDTSVFTAFIGGVYSF